MITLSLGEVPYFIHQQHLRHVRLSRSHTHTLLDKQCTVIHVGVYTTGIQYGFRQDVCHCPELHLQNIQHETVTYLHEHLTVAHFLHVQLCRRSTGNNCTSHAVRSIPYLSIISFKTKLSRVKSGTCVTVHVDMGRVD